MRSLSMKRYAAVLAAGITSVAFTVGNAPVATASFTSAAIQVGSSATTQAAHETPASCATAKRPGYATCDSVVYTPGSDHKIIPDASGPPSSALGPAQIRAAYNIPDGNGQTIAIVDAYGDSTAEADLATFRTHYGLPECTTDNGCFTKVDQSGGINYPGDNAGWAMETSLDLDAVSAACPNCKIMLVEANTAGVADLSAAVQEAIKLGAKFVSNSYGVPGEFAGVESITDYDHKGVAVVASTGDDGNIVQWPSSDPNVVAAGGTKLTQDTSTVRGWTETAWTSGGSGCSAYEPKPDYQLSVSTGCNNRATADISADADPATGLAIYSSLGQSGWMQVGGTSLSAPLITAMFALAGTPNADTYPVQGLYGKAAASHFFDVTAGSDGTCGNVLCNAGPGWDGPTGLGSPNGVTGLRQGPHGTITGTITDGATGRAIAGATVTSSSGAVTHTDTHGVYVFPGVDVGTYALTVTEYGYAAKTITDIAVDDQVVTTENTSLTAVPKTTVTGKVTDGSGHGWPVYAEISIAGDPNGSVFTDPATGKYRIEVPESAVYDARVTPVYDGYQTLDTKISVGTTASTENVSLLVDPNSCTAAGYKWNGVGTAFTGWTGDTSQDGWTRTGNARGWRFDNPGNRAEPPGSSGTFAIADSANSPRPNITTTLTSPTVNLSGQAAPQVSLDSKYIGASGQSGTVQLSTDDGRTWTNIWSKTTDITSGPMTIKIPDAADHARVKVRFTFHAKDGGYWAIDNPFIGTHTCVEAVGGLIIGKATNATTGAGLTGASIALKSNPSYPATTMAVQEDPGTTGLYWLFAPAGSQDLIATKSGYRTATATVKVQADRTVAQNWALSTGP